MNSALRDWIVENYGSMIKAGEAIGVHRNSVGRWATLEPEGILRHMPTIVDQVETSPAQLLDVVRQSMAQIKQMQADHFHGRA